MESILWGDILFTIFAIIAPLVSIGAVIFIVRNVLKNRKRIERLESNSNYKTK